MVGLDGLRGISNLNNYVRKREHGNVSKWEKTSKKRLLSHLCSERFRGFHHLTELEKEQMAEHTKNAVVAKSWHVKELHFRTLEHSKCQGRNTRPGLPLSSQGLAAAQGL